MSSILRIKRSELSGNPPILAAGELAYSALPDNGSNGGDRLYIGMGTESGGNAANHVVIGGKRYTSLIDAATHLATPGTFVRRDSNGGFVVTTITGNLTGNATTATAWETAVNLEITGDASAAFLGVDGTQNINAVLSLTATGVTPGTYGSSVSVPVFTVDAKGRVTQVTTADIATALTIAGTTGTDTVNLLSDVLTFAGGSGITTAVGSNTVTISLTQDLSPTGNVEFNDVRVNGKLYSNDITATDITVDGNANISGNLTVLGTVTTVNSTTVSIGDKNIELAKDATTAAMADGGGITIRGPAIPAVLQYVAASDRWELNKPLNVSTVYGDLSGNAATATKWQTSRTLTLTGDASASLSFDGSTNVSALITLATINNDVGAFGSNVTIPVITANSKGLITGISVQNIPTATISQVGLARFSSTNFEVNAGLVTISAVDGGTY